MTEEQTYTIPTICKNCGHALRSHTNKGHAKEIKCHYCDCKEFVPT